MKPRTAERGGGRRRVPGRRMPDKEPRRDGNPGPGRSQSAAPADSERDQAIVGRHAVREALRARQPLTRLLVETGANPGPLGDILALAREQAVPVTRVPRDKLEALAAGHAHQGVAALLAAAPHYTEADLEALVERASGPPWWLILDGIQDPENLGAILRVADGAGVHGVIVPQRGAVGLTPAVAKVAAGAASWVPVVRVVNLARAVTRLQRLGLFVYAAVPDGAVRYDEPDWTGPVAIVIGGEGQGVRPLVRARCDGTIRIPMAGRLGSLNAAAAAAVVAFEVVRQRRAGIG
jgi:23S rRNA (guanosine2251-2'-O)-methyltransferase